MGRRIEVELTSIKDESSWTWRAAGAKKPKGDLPASLLYDGAKVGDVVKVEAEFHVDGIEITEVFAPKAKQERSNLLEMKSRPLREDEMVTTQRVSRDQRDRKPGRRSEGRNSRSREDRSPDNRSSRPRRSEAEQRPKPKRLRPKRVHRDAYLASVAEEHRPIVEQVVRDGMPGVRAAIETQNKEAKAAGKPEIDPAPILAIAEPHLSPARLAEWQDKADAAMADADDLDLRDLRSLVVAGADVARTEETRATVEELRAVLERRLEVDHAAWLADVGSAVSEGRVVRGLRLSSRPVKAGAPLPTEIASKLAQQASEALASDAAQDRWATVLDALAFSPVRGAVTPAGIPAEPTEALLSEVRRLSDRLPAIAGLFGIDPADVPKSAKRRQPRRTNKNTRPKKATGTKPPGTKPAGTKPAETEPSETKPEAKKLRRPVPGAEKPEEASTPPEASSSVPAETPTQSDSSGSTTPTDKAEEQTPATSEPATSNETGSSSKAPIASVSETVTEPDSAVVNDDVAVNTNKPASPADRNDQPANAAADGTSEKAEA